MLPRKINAVPVKIKQQAFTLLEILVFTALGALLLFSFASAYRDFHRSQNGQKERLYLQAEAHQLLHYLQQHIQHVNYQGEKRTDSNVELFRLNGSHLNIVDKNCLIFFYDVNQDGCLGKRRTKTTACRLGNINNSKEVLKEVFGFKTENKEIYYYVPNADNCIQAECQKLLASCNGLWNKFTDSYHFSVNKFEFSWKKAGEILAVKLELQSAKEPETSYAATGYIFLFNR